MTRKHRHPAPEGGARAPSPGMPSRGIVKARPAFLGGLDAATFMRRHWQKKPLLVRGAFREFADPLAPGEVLALAGSPDATSRLVRRRGRSWSLENGPFPASRFKQLPRRDWTVLVQDTNHFSDRAQALLARFDFLPHARVDDLMVSYAVPGGTVGPHVDSYDVFLLQGAGRRRWQISRQRDLDFVEGLPLRILARFEPEDEWVLEPGDLLYLPPDVAHYGVAESECLTWSVGLRAPSDQELQAAFLDFVHERLDPPGRYADPGASPARHPGAVPGAMVAHARRTLATIRWTARDVREFAGRYLSEPKPQVWFEAPRRPLSRTAFAKRAGARGLRLDRRSRLLFSGTMFFMNGEALRVARAAHPVLRALADRRELGSPLAAPAAFWELAHGWYLQGFVHADRGERS